MLSTKQVNKMKDQGQIVTSVTEDCDKIVWSKEVNLTKASLYLTEWGR